MTDHDPSAPNRRRVLGLVVVAVVSFGLVAGGAALGPAFGQHDDSTNQSENETAATQSALPTVDITRGDLVETADKGGTVGHGTAWNLPVQAEGVVTEAPKSGTVIEPGKPLLHVAGRPVFLAEGAMPLYRTLSLQFSAAKRLKGDDVAQLQRFLIDQGFDDNGRMSDDGEFGRSTERAVKAWQKEWGFDESGAVDRTQLVFHPGAIRVETIPRVGADFDQLEVTDATQEVVAEFDPDQRPFVPVGADVTVEVDAETSVSGTVTETSSTVGAEGQSKLEVRITPVSPLPTEVQRVKVRASRVRASDVLIVPARAVVALASGGYGLEVATSSGPELRRVELGVVVDDQVEITGDFAEGDEVHVPRQIGEEL